MRWHGLLPVPLALADDEHGGEGGDAGGDVHHGAPGKIEGAELVEPASVAPHPVGERVVHEGGPRQHEDDEGGELLALGEGARDERGGDHREHHLEEHEGLVGNGRGIRGIGLRAHPAQARPLEPADDASLVRPEGEGVAPEHPLHGDQGEDDEAVHERPERVLLPHHAAVEEREPRRGHQQDERRGHQHPRGVPRVDFGGGRRRRSRRRRGRRCGRRGLSQDRSGNAEAENS